MLKVKFHQNFEPDHIVYQKICSMTPGNRGVWKNVQVVDGDNYDVFVILNHPTHYNFDPAKTIVFQSETKSTRQGFPQFYKENKDDYLYIYNTEDHHNVDMWYHGLTYDELFNPLNFEKTKTMSVINSNLNSLKGHVWRNKFIDQLSSQLDFDLYGRFYTPNSMYKGSLHRKADGLMEYSYTFNCENDFEPNYFTEKILDGIYCECVTFYAGCPNIKSFIDERAFVELDIDDFMTNKLIIRDCLKSNIRKSMLPYILEEKRRLIVDMNLLNIVHNILEKV